MKGVPKLIVLGGAAEPRRRVERGRDFWLLLLPPDPGRPIERRARIHTGSCAGYTGEFDP